MSGDKPQRTIYRTGRGGAAEAAPPRPGDAGRRPRRRLREAWWLPPLLAVVILFVVFALIAFFVLGGLPLLQYVGITTSGRELKGTWGASNQLLGGTIVTIDRAGDGYAVHGVHIAGAHPAAVRSGDDGGLTVTGGSGGSAWTLNLSFVNRDQLRADVTFADGRPPVQTLLTRR